MSVHVIIRHGDRQNLHIIDNYEDIKIPCKLEKYSIGDVPEMAMYENFMRAETAKPPRRQDQSFSNWELFPDEDWCSPGELTPTGAMQHVKNGLLMRKRYVDNFNLFSKNKDVHSQILVRSTLWSRTYQSALALLFGLLKNFNVTQLHIETCDPSLCHEKYTDLPCNCPLVAPYMDIMSATYRQLHPDVMSISRSKNVIKHYAEVFGISEKQVPKLSNLMDIGMVHICQKHGLPRNSKSPESCTQAWAVRDVHDIIQDNGRKQSKSEEFQTIAKLKYLPLLQEITNRLLEQAHGDSDIKFALYSGHDTTINPLAIALNFSEGLWPPYASRIVIELYRLKHNPKTTSTDNFYLKVLFNGLNVNTEIEFCRKHLVSESNLCPLSIFVDYVQNMLKNLGKDSYEDACRMPL